MPAVLILLGAVAVLVGSFSISWQVGVVAVGVLVIAAGADEARK